MKKSPGVILLPLLLLTALAQPDPWIRIDCGSNQSTPANGYTWETDDTYIKAGTNHPIPEDMNLALPYLNTLRVFDKQNKNCYTLPALTQTRYFIRAAFYYANYDGLNRPPSFDLQIDGNKMDTVVSTSDGVTISEIIYWCQRDNMSVCLARTRDGEIPFISSLEAWSIPINIYENMGQGLAWINSFRYNYGADNWIVGYPFDHHNRVWKPILTTPGTINISADDGRSLYDSTGETPPRYAILSAIQSLNETSSVLLTLSPVKTMTSIYIEVYFIEPQSPSLDIRQFNLILNGKSEGTVTPSYERCTSEVIIGQLTNSSLTIELTPTGISTLPPAVSAIEMYASSYPLITSGTSQDDLDGLEAITGAFDQLNGWSGEPCLPADTVWQWLGCSNTKPPRVTSINLSRYGLSGSLPDFSQMQAVETIDLSNNNLRGQIPSFLGQLPNLKTLNLSNNDFSGALPSRIRDKQGLVYDITGNPNIAIGKDKSSKGMIIGLAAGIPLAIAILMILALIFWRIRKPANQVQSQAPGGQDMGANGAVYESFTTSASTEVLITPPPRPTAPPMEATPEEDEDFIPISDVAVVKPSDQQSMVPEMDLDELEQLIDENARGAVMFDEDDDYVEIQEHGVVESGHQAMVPDMDLDELDEIIRHQKERADAAHGLGGDHITATSQWHHIPELP